MDLNKLRESQNVEFNIFFGKETIISLAAFANTSGGKVIVGMDDKMRVTGTEIGPEIVQQYLNEIKVSTYPQIIPKIEPHEIKGKTVLIFKINEYPVKPISFNNRYYTRIKNSNHLMTLDETASLQQQRLNISFDSYPLHKNLSSVDTGLFDKFAEKISSQGRINLQDDILTNLAKLKLIRDGSPTLASMLLFGDHGYPIHLGRFESEYTIVDDLLLKDPLLISLDKAMIFIRKHISLAYESDNRSEQKEKWQYPLAAIRELLLNAALHRDYKHKSDIVVKIFDDKILFTNPGRVYGNLKTEELEQDDYASSIRNKLLAESFYLMGDIEEYGTGFTQIRKLLEEYPEISFNIEETGNFFKAELFYPSLKRPVKEKVYLARSNCKLQKKNYKKITNSNVKSD